VCKYKLCTHDFSEDILAPDLERVYIRSPLFAAKTIWIYVENTSYLENKAVTIRDPYIPSPAKNWSRKALWLFGLDTFDFQLIFACYSWRVTFRAGSIHAFGAWVACCLLLELQ
jgi:hypothetical protein